MSEIADNKVKFLFWGTKNEGKANFFGSIPNVENFPTKDLRSTLYLLLTDEPIVYSLSIMNDYTVFSAYSFIYDHKDRKGWIAISIFVPRKFNLMGRTTELLAELMSRYFYLYVDENKRFKNYHENPEEFEQIISKYSLAETIDDDISAPIKDKNACVYYKSKEEIEAIFNYPYLREFAGYDQIYFIKQDSDQESTNLTELTVKPQLPKRRVGVNLTCNGESVSAPANLSIDGQPVSIGEEIKVDTDKKTITIAFSKDGYEEIESDWEINQEKNPCIIDIRVAKKENLCISVVDSATNEPLADVLFCYGGNIEQISTTDGRITLPGYYSESQIEGKLSKSGYVEKKIKAEHDKEFKLDKVKKEPINSPNGQSTPPNKGKIELKLVCNGELVELQKDDRVTIIWGGSKEDFKGMPILINRFSSGDSVSVYSAKIKGYEDIEDFELKMNPNQEHIPVPLKKKPRESSIIALLKKNITKIVIILTSVLFLLVVAYISWEYRTETKKKQEMEAIFENKKRDESGKLNPNSRDAILTKLDSLKKTINFSATDSISIVKKVDGVISAKVVVQPPQQVPDPNQTDQEPRSNSENEQKEKNELIERSKTEYKARKTDLKIKNIEKDINLSKRLKLEQERQRLETFLQVVKLDREIRSSKDCTKNRDKLINIRRALNTFSPAQKTFLQTAIENECGYDWVKDRNNKSTH